MRWLAVLFVVMLSGCFGSDGAGDGNTPDEPNAPAMPADAQIDRPTWVVGEWWRYTFQDGSAVRWVVTSADGDYTTDVDNGDLAFADAALEDTSTIGTMSADLAGSQDGEAVGFFDWPLTDGKTWSLTWDGLAFEANATVDGAQAVITATSGDIERSYGYDNATHWFTFIESRLNGSVEWRVEQTGHGFGYADTYVRYEIHDEQRMVFDPTAGQQGTAELVVPDDATDVWYDLDLTCVTASMVPGMIHYLLQPPSPTTTGLLVSSACPVTLDKTETLAPEIGTWRTVVDAQGIEGTITVVVRTLHEYTL